MYFGSRESLRDFSIENILTLSQICRLHLTFYEDVSRVTYTLHIAHRGALQLEIKMTGRIQVDLISGYESESDFQRNQLNGTVYHYLCVHAATRWISSDSMASFSLPPFPSFLVFSSFVRPFHGRGLTISYTSSLLRNALEMKSNPIFMFSSIFTSHRCLFRLFSLSLTRFLFLFKSHHHLG